MTLAALGIRASSNPSRVAFSAPVAHRAVAVGGRVPSTGKALISSRAGRCPNIGATSAAALGAGFALAISRGKRHLAVATQCASSMEKTAVQSKIEEVIALQPVVLFSKSTCPLCQKAKDAFRQSGLSKPLVYEIDKLDRDVADQIQDHLLALTGASSVPRVFIGHKFIGGGDETASLAETGELKSMISKALAEHQQDLNGADSSRLQKSEDEWRKELSPKQFRLLRERGTEMPGSHEYDQFYPERGYFSCAGCNLPLYSASSKFKSSCGWPVFDKCYHSKDHGSHVATRADGSGSLEIYCPSCGCHFGHVFFDAHSATNPNGERH